MKFRELQQHPEWRDFLSWLLDQVDSAEESVVIESKRSDLADIRFAAGRHAALQELFNSLRGE